MSSMLVVSIRKKTMRNRKSVLIAALAATLLLAVAVTSASARRLELSNTGGRIVWRSLEFVASGVETVRCQVTLEGTFHSRTISKVSGQLIGFITRAEVAPVCTGGRARANRETLPWHVRYDSFVGALPSISVINLQLVGASFNIESASIPGVSCRYTTTAREPGRGAARRNTTTAEITTLEASGEITSETFLCPRGRFAGSGDVTLLGNTTRILVRLVA